MPSNCPHCGAVHMRGNCPVRAAGVVEHHAAEKHAVSECVNPRLHCYCPRCVERRRTMQPINMMDALKRSIAEHPEAEKQRRQMHKHAREDFAARQREHEELRRQAEQRDERRNQPITRGEILDALDEAIRRTTAPAGEPYLFLQVLKEAFE